MFAININASPYRKQNIQILTDKLSEYDPILHNAIFPDINNQKVLDLFKSYDKEIRRKYGRAAKVGELGCVLTHQMMVKKFIKSSAIYGIFLEDDVLIDDLGLARLKKLINSFSNKNELDVLSILGAQEGINSIKPIIRLPNLLSKQYPLSSVLFPDRLTRTAAYMLSKNVALHYIWKDCADYDVADCWRSLISKTGVKISYYKIFSHPTSGDTLIK